MSSIYLSFNHYYRWVVAIDMKYYKYNFHAGKPLEVKLAMTVLVFRDMSEVDMVRI